MEQVNKNLVRINIVLLILVLLIVSYFVFINPKTRYEFDASKRVNKDFSWVLEDMNNEVKDLNQDLVSYYNYVDKAEIDLITQEESLTFKDAIKMDMPLYKYNKYIIFNSSVNSNHELYIVFIAANGNAYKYRIRNKQDYSNKVVNYAELPKGTYHIYIDDNGKKYDSLQYIKV